VDEDAWDEDEEDGPGEADEGDESPEGDLEEATVPCPYCKREIHEDSYRCPHCGNYLSEEDSVPSRKPWWIIVGAVLALYAVYRWIAG
jgi:hypothetical protein